uniref:Uncharacterized protein n=1 Tax=Tanacetum cinerariifolium TaxID=118510 RepID=A0A699J4K6_TANCI|nr:hypothetical protein [Tanacetum cinerariifolium]
MLVPQGEGLGTPTEPYHTPSLEDQHTSHTTHSSPTIPSITTAPISPVTSSDTPLIRQYTRRTRIAQSSDRATIAKTSTLPYDSTPRVISHVAAEGSMQQVLNELTTFCTSLQRKHSELISKFEAQELEINRLKVRVKLLEDREGLVRERSRDDAPIKGRNLDKGEAAAERVSDDTEEMATVLTSMDAATILAAGGADVPTGIFATTTMVTPYKRRKGKKIMVESETPKKKKVAKDAEITRIHVEKDLQSMINGLDRSNETVAKYLYQDNYANVHKFQTQQRRPWSKKQKRDYYMAIIKSNLGWKVKDFKGMTIEEIEAKFTTVWKQLEDFIPMGSKEEAERLKRKGLSLEQESAKKLKPSDEVPKEVKSPDEDKEIFMLVEKDYPLRKGLALVMICYKLQVKNYSQMANDLILKIYKIANCPSQNKMHKAFLLLVIEFLLAEEVPTASEESCHCQKKREATAKRIVLLVKV